MRATFRQRMRRAAQNVRSGLSDLAARLAEPAPAILRIGFSKRTIDLVLLKERAELELRLPSTRVQWMEFEMDSTMLAALRSGRLDLCATNGSAAWIALAAGLNARVVGVQPAAWSVPLQPPGECRSCTGAALKGPSVATRRSDVGGQACQLLPTPDLEGDLPGYRKLASGADRLPMEDGFYLAGVSFTERHPHALLTLFEELNAVMAWSRVRLQQAALLLSRTTGIAHSVAQQVLAERPFAPTWTVASDVSARLQHAADELAAIGTIFRPIDIGTLVWTPEGAAAVRALRGRSRHIGCGGAGAVCRC
jgi:ABC-type nitrate/sulfonate/bicarbonate transport system substrate-binding protein